MRKYLVREMFHLLKGRRASKSPGNSSLDSHIFFCYKTEYTFSIHFNCPPSYLHTTKNTCVWTYKKIVYKVLIPRSPQALPLALSRAQLGSPGAPWLSAHCPACLSSALGMLPEKELAAASSPWATLGDCVASFTSSLEAGRRQGCKEAMINLRRHKVQEEESINIIVSPAIVTLRIILVILMKISKCQMEKSF